ncbi:MAG: WbuC family cupin fold metalloprotein [Prosthecobacter sp.]|jgi:cupin fold WbuC family metalloprotein
MPVLQRSSNVFVLTDSPDVVSSDIIAELKRAADASPLRRARLCLHRSNDDPVHEMLIVLCGGVYIRPHRHLGKPESFHLLEGEVSAIFFNDDGTPEREERLGRGPGESFIYRVTHPVYHTQLVWSEHVVFYECTRGPFRKEETEFASWAPGEGTPAAEEYLNQLKSRFGAA